jgi:hypothetical protein
MSGYASGRGHSKREWYSQVGKGLLYPQKGGKKAALSYRLRKSTHVLGLTDNSMVRGLANMRLADRSFSTHFGHQ